MPRPTVTTMSGRGGRQTVPSLPARRHQTPLSPGTIHPIDTMTAEMEISREKVRVSQSLATPRGRERRRRCRLLAWRRPCRCGKRHSTPRGQFRLVSSSSRCNAERGRRRSGNEPRGRACLALDGRLPRECLEMRCTVLLTLSGGVYSSTSTVWLPQ